MRLSRFALLRRHGMLAIGLVFLGVLPGCGPRRQKVRVQLTHNGRPYTPAKNELLLVILVPEAKAGSAVSVTYPANPVGEGVYEVLGEGVGIPPGRYHVRIENPMNNSSVPIPAALASSESPVVREVVLGIETLDPIDLAKVGQ